MKKKLLMYLIVGILIIPKNYVLALSTEKEEEQEIAVTEKYYKTVNERRFFGDFSRTNNYTIEITKEEYDSIDVVDNSKGDATSETTYKKLTTTIRQNGNKYQYKAVLNWKNFPNVRSYDIIGIGYYPSVIIDGSPNFSLYTCFSGGSCVTTTTHYPQTFSSGVGTSFKLPTGNLTTLRATLYFNVIKNTTATVTSQVAAGDYAHATSNVTSSQSQNYTVNASGISLGGSISNYYDAMNSAIATWSGNW